MKYQVVLSLYFSMDCTEQELKNTAKRISDKAEVIVVRNDGTGFLPVLKSNPSLIPQEK
jgi:hypothetical protein